MVNNDVESLFNQIYDMTNSRVMLFITGKCGNTADINDIFQETYMELYEVIQKKGGAYIQIPEAFVMKIARRKVFKFYSTKEKVKNIALLYRGNESDEAEALENVSDDYSLETDVENDMTIAQVVEFLSDRPEDIKKIFYLFYYHDQSISNIAKTLNLSESNVKNKLYRTLKELRGMLNH